MGLHRTTIELDTEKLAEVASVLGTKGIKPTVDAAFDEVLRTRRVGKSVAFFAELAARDDLTERETMWR